MPAQKKYYHYVVRFSPGYRLDGKASVRIWSTSQDKDYVASQALLTKGWWGPGTKPSSARGPGSGIVSVSLIGTKMSQGFPDLRREP